MTVQYVNKFKEDFKKIVFYKGLIINQKQYVSRVHSWDKDGSHKNAIEKAINELNEMKQKFEKMLCERSYEDWKIASKQISLIMSKLKLNDEKHDQLLKELSKISF